MYLGLILMLLGTTITLSNYAPFLVVPLFARWITTHFVAKEERMLTDLFGEKYIEYKQKVRCRP
jgi:protein-S-isoprenylcysteine O-methyltransferase Ste14